MDRGSRFFYTLEKTRGARKHVTCLLAEDGAPLTDPVEMCGRARDFYTSLFSPDPTNPGACRVLWEELPMVSVGNRDRLELPLTLAEFSEALRRMPTNKSPGMDELTVEFYCVFWDILGPDLATVWAESLQGGVLPLSCRRAVLALLLKKGDLCDLRNWRPVSLLSTDYKIVAKAISLRLGSMMADVIHPDQTCTIPGRSIFDNLFLVRDLLELRRRDGLLFALLSLDQEKAFDRVDHGYLLGTLQAFGFGPQFLYALAIEPFLCLLRRRLTGLVLREPELWLVLSAYADDVLLVVQDLGDLARVEACQAIYSAASSTRVNWVKSSGLAVGDWQQPCSCYAGRRQHKEQLQLTTMQAHELFRHLRMPELDDVRQYIRTLPTNTLMGFGAFAALTTYWYATRPKALKPPCDLAMQSLEVEGGEHARRSSLLNSDELLTYYYDDVRTVYEIFQRGLEVSNNGPCLGVRKPNQPYEWISYKEVSERAEYVGSALLHRGYKPAPDQYIGIFAQNRLEWVLIEQGCYTYSMVVVPLYDTLGADAISYIVNKADVALVFCDKSDKAKLLLDNVERGETPVLNTIVIMESFDSDLVERGKKRGVEILSLRELEEVGRAHRRKPVPPSPEDLAVICFTSGTTGNPKGAMITHQNIVSNASAFLKATEKAIIPATEDVLISFLPLAHMFERIVESACVLNPSDTHISFLPLAHMFERLVQCVILCHGARIGFFQGDIRLLMDDLKTLQPTIFPVVPRLLNRMFDKIFGQANTSLKRWILDFASKRKEAELRSGIIRKNSLWDKLIFHKIQASLGGKVRLMITGAAPVSASVLTFLRAALGCQFYEGYGQTECTAGCSLTLPGDWTAGHVGPPMPCSLLKLVDVEEMNYFAVKGEGEVCVKGPNVFQGYLKDPEKTAEALDKDGWLHTGDIGKWLPNGTLKIIDRKKHIFKLAQGEYIAPEKIENVYTRSEPVAQVFVYGESLQAFLIAIVVPDAETLSNWAKKKGFEGSYEELCKNKDLKKHILEDMLKVGKESGLKSFEQVKGIALSMEMFSIENGLLTPTLKAKRRELQKFFKSQIDELSANIRM
ncbi:unnamed protein product [Caretta caretta]